MSRGMLLSLVNLALVAGLVLSVSDALAQQQQLNTGDGPRLVSTNCGFGRVTVCGTEPVGQVCTYVFGINASKTGGTFGFNFGGYQCTGGGTQNRYKDYDPNTAAGTCVVISRPPADATGTSREDEPEYEETC